MRKLATIVALGLLTLACTAMATMPPTADEPGITEPSGGGGGVRSNDCPGVVVFDSGMTDDFTPPAGCSSAGGVNCWVNAPGQDLRPVKFEIADEFTTAGETLTHVKFWERTNCESENGNVHPIGYCLVIYETAPADFFCPDGINPAELGTVVYDAYCDPGQFTEFKITDFLLRNYNVCAELDFPVPTSCDKAYWLAVSADMPYSDLGDPCDTGAQNTLVFVRFTNQNLGFTACEAVIRGCEPDGTLCDPWIGIAEGFALPCWAGWDMGMVIYGNAPATGACCAPSGTCSVSTACECFGIYLGDDIVCDPNPCEQPVTGACCLGTDCIEVTQSDCESFGGLFQGPGTICGPETCNPIATEKTTWGGVKNKYGR